MKAPAIHRRKRAPLSLQGADKCIEAIDRALAMDWPPGYRPRLFAEWKSTARISSAATVAREALVARGITGDLGPLSNRSER